MSFSNVVRGLGVFLAMCFAFTATVSAGDPPAPKPSSKWRIEFDHWSETDGELVLEPPEICGLGK